MTRYAVLVIDMIREFCDLEQGLIPIENAARMLPRLLVRRHLGARGVLFRRAGWGRITPAAGGLLPHVQLDGEVGLGPWAGPITLTVEAGAVRMLAPQPGRPLFGPPPARPGPTG